MTEQYNKYNQTYLFIIKDNKLEIPYQVIHKYIKKRKLITNIKVEEISGYPNLKKEFAL